MREEPNLASEIMMLMARHDASDKAGITAMYEALIVSLVTRGVSKQSAVDMLSQCWDKMAPAIIEARKGLFDG